MARYKPFILRVGRRAGDVYPIAADAPDWHGEGVLPAELPQLSQADLQQAGAWQERAFTDRDHRPGLCSRSGWSPLPHALSAEHRPGLPRGFDRIDRRKDCEWCWICLPTSPTCLGSSCTTKRAATVSWRVRLRRRSRAIFRIPALPRRHATEGGGPAPCSRDHRIASQYNAVERCGGSISPYQKSDGAPARPGSGARPRCRAVAPQPILARSGARLTHRELVEIEVHHNATYAGIQGWLVAAKNAGRPFHVIHFIGHGATDECGGVLLLETEEEEQRAGRIVDAVSAERFAELVAETSVSLVTLNACQTAGALDGV